MVFLCWEKRLQEGPLNYFHCGSVSNVIWHEGFSGELRCGYYEMLCRYFARWQAKQNKIMHSSITAWIR